MKRPYDKAIQFVCRKTNMTTQQLHKMVMLAFLRSVGITFTQKGFEVNDIYGRQHR